MCLIHNLATQIDKKRTQQRDKKKTSTKTTASVWWWYFCDSVCCHSHSFISNSQTGTDIIDKYVYFSKCVFFVVVLLFKMKPRCHSAAIQVYNATYYTSYNIILNQICPMPQDHFLSSSLSPLVIHSLISCRVCVSHTRPLSTCVT